MIRDVDETDCKVSSFCFFKLSTMNLIEKIENLKELQEKVILLKEATGLPLKVVRSLIEKNQLNKELVDFLVAKKTSVDRLKKKSIEHINDIPAEIMIEISLL